MHYFVDGYNLFFKLPEEQLTLGREKIITALQEAPLALTLVFDGRGDPLSERTHKGGLEIVYTAKGETADNYIIAELDWRKHPGDYTVVTSDKRLAMHCRVAGARVQSIRAFLTMLEKKQAVKVLEKPLKESSKDFERLLKIFSQG